MGHQPQVSERPAQPYLAVRAHVPTEADFRAAADRAFPQLFGWLGEQRIAPAGPPFIRYLLLDHRDQPLDVDLAVPLAAPVSADGRLLVETLPAGRYAIYLHVGPYRSQTDPDLRAARSTLREWCTGHGVALDQRETEDGVALGGCIERYIVGPYEDPDHTRWQTELAYLTAG